MNWYCHTRTRTVFTDLFVVVKKIINMMANNKISTMLLGRRLASALASSRRGLIIPAAFGLTTATTTTTVLCQQQRPRVPPRFGPSIRASSSLGGQIDTNNKEDCPLCKLYSQGPCGESFKKWLACTDKHAGKNDDDGEPIHLKKCQSLFTPFQECVQKHEDYYESIDIYAQDEGSDEEELLQAWTAVIEQVEEQNDAVAFPSALLPDVQIRPQNKTGMASFLYKHDGSDDKKIVMCHVRDDDTGEILAAGSSEDLIEYETGKGVLRLSFGPKCRSATFYALYSNEEDVLYKHTLRMPPL